uniref:Uncharacterized protein n=1 Tax=Spongospora subterranea TaxID=70186 RepID=A0A0H5QUK0_9EUKA|eukprot:CRZ05251.1 hypothetical protein [Spongospora subterranea]
MWEIIKTCSRDKGRYKLKLRGEYVSLSTHSSLTCATHGKESLYTPFQKVLMSQENASKAGNQQKKKGNQTIKEVVKVTNGTVTPGTAAHRTGIEVYHIQVELTQEEGAAHKQAEIASTQLRSTLRRKDNQVMEETLEKTIGTITVGYCISKQF